MQVTVAQMLTYAILGGTKIVSTERAQGSPPPTVRRTTHAKPLTSVRTTLRVETARRYAGARENEI